ncbi:MAG: glycosyltransferase family 4 protein [Actinomycetota bacterium]
MTDAVLVSSSFLPGRGGIESHLAELCALLRPRLAVLAPALREGNAIPDDLGYPVQGHPGSMLIPTRTVADAIERAAHACGTRKVLFGTPWPLVLLGPNLKRRGLRYAVIVHGAEVIVPGTTPLLRRSLARALAEAELLLPVSEFTATKLRLLLGETNHELPRIDVLRARIDLERFRPRSDGAEVRRRLGLTARDRLVLCFGRLVKRKGIHRLLDAYPDLVARVPEAAVVIAGTGPEERSLRRLAHRKDARVVFTGRVSEDGAPALYAAADVFALPVVDRWLGLEVEGLGVVLLEAAASGVPSVTGRSGGTPEAVIDGKTGFVVDAGQRSQLVRAIARILNDPSLGKRLGAAGRKHVQSEFSSGPPQVLLDWLA